MHLIMVTMELTLLIEWFTIKVHASYVNSVWGDCFACHSLNIVITKGIRCFLNRLCCCASYLSIVDLDCIVLIGSARSNPRSSMKASSKAARP